MHLTLINFNIFNINIQYILLIQTPMFVCLSRIIKQFFKLLKDGATIFKYFINLHIRLTIVYENFRRPHTCRKRNLKINIKQFYILEYHESKEGSRIGNAKNIKHFWLVVGWRPSLIVPLNVCLPFPFPFINILSQCTLATCCCFVYKQLILKQKTRYLILSYPKYEILY